MSEKLLDLMELYSTLKARSDISNMVSKKRHMEISEYIIQKCKNVFGIDTNGLDFDDVMCECNLPYYVSSAGYFDMEEFRICLRDRISNEDRAKITEAARKNLDMLCELYSSTSDEDLKAMDLNIYKFIKVFTIIYNQAYDPFFVNDPDAVYTTHDVIWIMHMRSMPYFIRFKGTPTGHEYKLEKINVSY